MCLTLPSPQAQKPIPIRRIFDRVRALSIVVRPAQLKIIFLSLLLERSFKLLYLVSSFKVLF